MSDHYYRLIEDDQDDAYEINVELQPMEMVDVSGRIYSRWSAITERADIRFTSIELQFNRTPHRRIKQRRRRRFFLTLTGYLEG